RTNKAHTADTLVLCQGRSGPPYWTHGYGRSDPSTTPEPGSVPERPGNRCRSRQAADQALRDRGTTAAVLRGSSDRGRTRHVRRRTRRQSLATRQPFRGLVDVMADVERGRRSDHVPRSELPPRRADT